MVEQGDIVSGTAGKRELKVEAMSYNSFWLVVVLATVCSVAGVDCLGGWQHAAVK